MVMMICLPCLVQSGTIQGDYYVIEIDSETDVLDCTGSNHLMYFILQE